MENYTSDSSDGENSNKVLDFAYLLFDPDTLEHNLDEISNQKQTVNEDIENVILHHNRLTVLPKNLRRFPNVQILDISNNGLRLLPDIFEHLPFLTTVIAKNNFLTNESLPKCFTESAMLRELNLSGNFLAQFPEQLLDFVNLKYLYLGGNKMGNISRNIWKLHNLQVLSMGGNELVDVPSCLGQLKHLSALMLCDNQIEFLPAQIANLHHLKSLLLHKNRLRTLPPEIIALKNLTELSLRDNPLVVRFVSNINNKPATLLELSARSIKLHNVRVKLGDVPKTLLNYLDSAHHCVNPHCKGVFFDNRVEHVKFVDFCGKYRIPLLQYLCSTRCVHEEDVEDLRPRPYLMKKVLLG